MIVAAVNEEFSNDIQLSEAMRTHSFLKVFPQTIYSEYLHLPDTLVDTLLGIEDEVQKKAKRKHRRETRRAKGTPTRTRGNI